MKEGNKIISILILLVIAVIAVIFLSDGGLSGNTISPSGVASNDSSEYTRIENSGYYKKGSEVFYSRDDKYKLIDVDLKSFKTLSNEVAKDSKNVYIKNRIQQGIDSESFTSYFFDRKTRMYVSFYSDKNNIYYVKNDNGLTLAISPFDPRQAEFVGDYLKTKDVVYFPGYDTLTKIDGIDADTFRVLGTCATFEMSHGTYMIDKNNVYVGTTIFREADPETFNMFATFGAKPGDEFPYTLTIWKDKNSFFASCGEVIKEADYSTFEYIGDNKAQDKNNIYSFTIGGGYKVEARK